MELRTLGATGLKVSPICLGTMQFGWTADEALSFRVLSAAREAGVNFIDTADIYSRWVDGNPGGVAEQIVGRWMKQNAIPRGEVVLATKVRGNMGGGAEDEGLSRRHIVKAVEDSLRRLQTDHLDLYQAHWPDTATPIEETLRAFDELVRQGKVRCIGASNYAAWELMQALWTSDKNSLARFDSLQPHYNLVHREEFERELAAVCRTYQIGVIPYSPLAGGFLTGKYRRNLMAQSARAGGVRKYFTERNWTALDKMDEMAKRKNASISQIALAWLLADPLVTSPIIGANSLEQLKDNLGAAEIRLTIAEKAALDKLTAWQNEEQ
ncbi:MAG: putative oxidoreductase [Anaerolineaceae bacterium]|nr:MAG: putative oxidoreductase [Anaerolineaceae bacterium]